MSAPPTVPGAGAGAFALIEESPGAPAPDLRQFAALAWSRRRLFAAAAFGGALLALLVSFIVPPTYVAGLAMLEAPKQGGGASVDQLSLSAELLGVSGGAMGGAPTYPDFLRSRRLLERLLVIRFPDRHGHLQRLVDVLEPGPDSPQRTDRAVEDLRRNFDISLDRHTNLLRLNVPDHDPVRAAAVANAACAELQNLVTHDVMTQAGANRQFIESRMAVSEQHLAEAEESVRAFRETNARTEGSPRLALEFARRVREVRRYEEVVISLTRQYETARIDENRNVPVLNVIDPAEPPAFRSSPRRGLMVVGGFLLGLAAAVVVVWPRRAEAKAVRLAVAA